MKVPRFLKPFKYLSFNTLYINFRYLPFKQAVKLPFWVSRKCQLMETRGRVLLPKNIQPGMIRIGYGQIGVADRKYSRCIWELRGTLEFKGTATIGPGSKLNVGNKARLVLGDNLSITANTAIACHYQIQIGSDCLFSWESQVMDTDFHSIFDEEGSRLNPDSPVVIGDSVWVGSRCSILKGSEIPNGSVIASNAVVNKKFDNPNTLIGGAPAKVLKEGIHWKA